jgi:phosphinothricin acetyltransferase
MKIIKTINFTNFDGCRSIAAMIGRTALSDVIAVRDAAAADIPAIQRIYAHHVLHGLASFEETPPSVEEMAARRVAAIERGLPYIVAEIGGTVAGYSYATPYRPRPAYRYTVENSVYVDAARHRRGVGRALLAALIARCEAGPWRQMVAVIGDSANAASIGLHERLGFRRVGTLPAVGFKLGRWVDSVLMQREIGGEAVRPSTSSG